MVIYSSKLSNYVSRYICLCIFPLKEFSYFNKIWMSNEYVNNNYVEDLSLMSHFEILSFFPIPSVLIARRHSILSLARFTCIQNYLKPLAWSPMKDFLCWMHLKGYSYSFVLCYSFRVNNCLLLLLNKIFLEELRGIKQSLGCCRRTSCVLV